MRLMWTVLALLAAIVTADRLWSAETGAGNRWVKVDEGRTGSREKARRFDDGQTRYEAAGHGDHHDHLICTSCGRIVEFENERIEELQLRVARSHGFEVQSHKLELYGRCDGCRGTAAGREAAK